MLYFTSGHSDHAGPCIDHAGPALGDKYVLHLVILSLKQLSTFTKSFLEMFN